MKNLHENDYNMFSMKSDTFNFGVIIVFLNMCIYHISPGVDYITCRKCEMILYNVFDIV